MATNATDVSYAADAKAGAGAADEVADGGVTGEAGAERVAGGPGLVLRTPEGRPYRFDPGALCLELLTTGGPGPLARYEVLDTPAGLRDWVAASRLDPGLRLDVREGDLAAAREVRDALHSLASRRAHGRAPDPADVAVLNACAAGPPLAVRMTADGTREWAPGTGTVAELLSTVARDAIDLFTGPYARRVRECGAHDCYLLFVDTSRPGRRRWCAMERCGNRHKVRAHRARTGPEGDAMTPPAPPRPATGRAATSGTAGLTKDAGWEIGVSKTLPLPAGAVWDFIASPDGVALWLGTVDGLPTEKGARYETADGVTGEVRSHRPGDRIRVTHGDTTIQVAVSAAGPGKSVLRFHQEHLADAEERERRRTHWKAVMERVAGELRA
jgi:predicted RNA-binding Zn ribbon-like protein/uncharacterized protein YndB with AHSA1/START domain